MTLRGYAPLVRASKGGKDRVTVLPEELEVPLRGAIASARRWFERDLAVGVAADAP